MLDVARQQVTKGRVIVARQRQIVEAFKAGGKDAREAESTLDVFERTLAILEEHVERLATESKRTAKPFPLR